MSVSASRQYPEGALPAASLGDFFREVETLVVEKGAERTGTVRVSIDHSGGMTEYADWSIQQLYAVTDLRTGHPGRVTYDYSVPGGLYEVQVHAWLKALWLSVIAPDAQVAGSLLSLGDHYLAHPEPPIAAADTDATHPHGEPPMAAAQASASSPHGSASATTNTLDWFEHHSAYRVLVIVGSAAAGIAVLYAVVRLIVALAH